MSYLTAFVLTNQLLYMNFPSLESKIFQKDLKSMLPSSVALCFVTSVIERLRNENEDKTKAHD